MTSPDVSHLSLLAQKKRAAVLNYAIFLKEQGEALIDDLATEENLEETAFSEAEFFPLVKVLVGAYTGSQTILLKELISFIPDQGGK